MAFADGVKCFSFLKDDHPLAVEGRKEEEEEEEEVEEEEEGNNVNEHDNSVAESIEVSNLIHYSVYPGKNV